MTRTEINKAAKKADTALCKVQDLFTGYDINERIASRVDKACDSIRELIAEIESTEPKRKIK